MDGIDRYVLGLAVLEGDRDARKILADLLEEQGDRGLADWARRCKGKSNRRLDLAIMLLPCQCALKLASECITQAAVERLEREFAKAASDAINAWCLGEIEIGKVVSICQNALRKTPSNPVHMYNTIFENRQDQARRFYVKAVENVGFSFEAATLDPRLIHHFESQANQSVREVVRITQTSIAPAAVESKERRLSGLEWQVAFTKGIFNHLISPIVFTWPQ